MTGIKICGVRNKQIAMACINLGADFIGLVFCEDSPRYITLDAAAEIADLARLASVTPVAVFNRASINTILDTCEHLNITHVQLHGEQAKGTLNTLPESLHKIYVVNVNQQGAIAVDDNVSLLRPQHDYILFDGEQAGSGQSIALNNIRAINGLRFFLAGGLNAQNVQAAINVTHPFAVDVSSGVELTRGEKSVERITQFIEQVRALS